MLCIVVVSFVSFIAPVKIFKFLISFLVFVASHAFTISTLPSTELTNIMSPSHLSNKKKMSVAENHSNFTVLISSFSLQTETNREGGEGVREINKPNNKPGHDQRTTHISPWNFGWRRWVEHEYEGGLNGDSRSKGKWGEGRGGGDTTHNFSVNYNLLFLVVCCFERSECRLAVAYAVRVVFIYLFIYYYFFQIFFLLSVQVAVTTNNSLTVRLVEKHSSNHTTHSIATRDENQRRFHVCTSDLTIFNSVFFITYFFLGGGSWFFFF